MILHVYSRYRFWLYLEANLQIYRLHQISFQQVQASTMKVLAVEFIHHSHDVALGARALRKYCQLDRGEHRAVLL